jgi:hypothetical protein
MGGDTSNLRVSINLLRHLSTIDARFIHQVNMLPFSTLILRSYYQAIGWNQDNSYSQLNRSSNGKSLPKSRERADD